MIDCGRWGGRSSDKAGARDASVHVPVNQQWLSHLESALGKESFPQVFARLKSDSSMSREDLASLAKAFYGGAAPSTSRSESLKRILSRHEKIWKFKNDVSTSGRSAG